MNSQPLDASGTTALLPSTPSQSQLKTAPEAARAFEALLIAQMLRTAREASEDMGADSTGEIMLDVAGQQFSQMIADHGGFGIAKEIEKGLA